MRLFTAIDLDEQARERVAAEQKRLQRAFGHPNRSVRWVRADQMHITLVFIGEVDDARSASIVNSMARQLSVPVFRITFGGLGVFPPHGAPNVLWLGVTSGVDEAVALHRAVGERLEPDGVPREKRPYHPHLTLARWRSGGRADRARVREFDKGAEVARLVVESVVLYRSQVSSAGSTYTELARAPLAAAHK